MQTVQPTEQVAVAQIDAQMLAWEAAGAIAADTELVLVWRRGGIYAGLDPEIALRDVDGSTPPKWVDEIIPAVDARVLMEALKPYWDRGVVCLNEWCEVVESGAP